MNRPAEPIPGEFPVLIVGGGPVGLSASLMLSCLGVESLLVERHPSTSIHPKARGINPRTMEIFRQFGIEQAVRDAGLPPERARFIISARSLAGEELERRTPWRGKPAAQQLSPVLSCLCAQDDLEPVLRRFAEAAGPGTLRFNTEVLGVHLEGGEDGGVTATLLDRVTGVETRVRSRFLIAADGARSGVREQLGISMHGRGEIYRSVNILFHADLTPWVVDRPAALYFIEQPGLTATFLTINGVNRWGFLVNNLPSYDERAVEYTEAQCREVILRAVGVADLDVEVLGAVQWAAAAQVAERYREAAIFLAGDAAHQMPPTGGFGMNTGVQDVHNLAWKLAAVLQGWAAPSLLDSYEAERRPAGLETTEQSLQNALSMGRGSPTTSVEEPVSVGAPRARQEYLNELGLIFGALYDSSAVVPDGTAPPALANAATDYVPVARPGSRAPHVWLRRGGERLSVLDLFGREFVLLADAAERGWPATTRTAAGTLEVPLQCWQIGAGTELGDDAGGDWRAAYGIEQGGAVLVRPDGYVAWRSHTSRPGAEALQEALASCLGRTPADGST